MVSMRTRAKQHTIRKEITIFDQFWLLTWKNCLIQIRNQTRTNIEITAFLAFVLPFCFIHISGLYIDLEVYESFAIDNLDSLRFVKTYLYPTIQKNCSQSKWFYKMSLKYATFRESGSNIDEWKLVYTPKNDVLENLLESTIKLLGLSGTVAVNSSRELEEVMIERKLIAGIDFQHLWV